MGCNFYPMRFRVSVYIPLYTSYYIANGYGFTRAVHGETQLFPTLLEK